MALIRNFKALTGNPNSINLSWDLPEDFNNSEDEIIITRSSTHFASELYNDSFPTKATDNRPIEVFRGKTIVGINTATISVLGNVLTDTAASFPTNPSLAGRLLRDYSSKVHRIVSNTSTTITLLTTPENGKYVILPDFPQEIFIQQNFEDDSRTTAGSGYISNLVTTINGNLQPIIFEPNSLTNFIFQDDSGDSFVIKSNDESTIYFFETDTPALGETFIKTSFVNNNVYFYTDLFLDAIEAGVRTGTGLLNDQFYYYTGFTKPELTNVAQAELGLYRSKLSTQVSALSIKNKEFGSLLYNYWPSVYKELDITENLQDLMEVFGHQLNQLHSYIDTYRLQDYNSVFVNALVPLSEQNGLPSVGFSIGIDTMRRVVNDIIKANKLKGTKEGIALFIKIITTWDITDGTGDFSSAISDYLPNVAALRLFDENLGVTNSRITESGIIDPTTEPPTVIPFTPGGRFVKSLPGIIIPGFFTFREFVITIPNVALFLGDIETFSVINNNTTITDNEASFGTIDSLKGNYIIPNQEEPSNIFKIIGNTDTSITVSGIIPNRTIGSSYAVLSPLNTNRFIVLNKLLPNYIPLGTKAGFIYI